MVYNLFSSPFPSSCLLVFFSCSRVKARTVKDVIRVLDVVNKIALVTAATDAKTQEEIAAISRILGFEVKEKEEGHTWMRAKEGDYIFITESVLQRHKEFCKRSDGIAYQSLSQLAVDLTAHTGESCKRYEHSIGRDQETDDVSSRILKIAVAYRKRKVVRVPLSLQGRLTAANTSNITTTTKTTTASTAEKIN